MFLEDQGFTKKIWLYVFGAIAFHLFMMMLAPNQPLLGPHKIRQADTLFSSYSYCKENADFFKPRIMHREGSNGVAVGEFPVYNYLMSVPCKVTGIWSVNVIRAFAFLFYVLNFFLLGIVLKIAWKKMSWEWLTLFWFFTPLWFVYGPMPIPDGFALTLFLLTWIYSLKKQNKGHQFTQDLLLVMIFLIRPYFFPMFFLVRPHIRHFGWVTFLCALAYVVWFKWWVPMVTEVNYYAVSPKPFRDLFLNWWDVFNAFIDQTLYHHVNYLGVIFLVAACMKERKLFLCWLGSWLFIMAVKADHFVNHPYYMMSAAFFALLLMLRSDFLERVGRRSIVVFAILYILVCIGNIQHHFIAKRDWIFDAGEEVQKQTQFNEKIAMYAGRQIIYLYAAMRTGWMLNYEDFKNGENCPESAVWAWQVSEYMKVSKLVRCTSGKK